MTNSAQECAHVDAVTNLVDRYQRWAGYECPYCEIDRLQKKLRHIADLLDEGAYGMATDEARGT